MDIRSNFRKRGIATIASLGAAALVITSCGGDNGAVEAPEIDEDCEPLHEFPTLEEGVLEVAAMNAPPKFHALSDSGPFEGIDAILITEFAAENCLEVNFKPMTGAAAQLDLSEGNSDLFGGLILKTEERGEVFGQAEGYIIYETVGFTSHVDDSFESVDEMEGIRVGTLSGSTYVEPLREAFGADMVEEYQSDTNAFEDLRAGRIDAIGWQSMQGFNFSEQDEDYVTIIPDEDPDHPELTQLFENNWPHTKDVPELTEAIDDYYERAHEDGTIEEALAENDIDGELADFYLNGR
ncbi:amino acid ABC transporter substrate-binding protein [Nesterenkonia sp. MY13]|uniref:Amino acid ABC transporter substrate-binding protein n=1 Tax=Nesterenkonia sedimenti TaxID=1463632 RepID=A0A7X8TIB6_9MICC|nr:transporter substrate-binding domain-containing protein [Nesterenkonia sedimenti]NLS09239.1 amino acid ABC transporter substrate-binding protein [Nesterenkonia sedimenti]